MEKPPKTAQETTEDPMKELKLSYSTVGNAFGSEAVMTKGKLLKLSLMYKWGMPTGRKLGKP